MPTKRRKAGGEIEALFTVAPEEFVAERDRLAKRLREEGDRDGAAEVKALRRPTVPAWALNQLARRHPDDVEELLKAGQDLRKAQDRAFSGRGQAGFRDQLALRRNLVTRLTGLARTVLGEAGRDTDAYRDAVATTLEAAVIDPDAGELLRKGRLAREIAPGGVFAGVDELTAGGAGPAPRSGRGRAPGGGKGRSQGVSGPDRAAAAREAAERRSSEVPPEVEGH